MDSAPVSKGRLWTSYVLSALPVLLLVFSASMKFMNPPGMAANMEHLGYPMSVLLALGITEITCTVLYVIPRTSVMGAILLTGYLGGATATHVRIGEILFLMPVLLGIMLWLGLWLREPRLHALTPLRK